MTQLGSTSAAARSSPPTSASDRRLLPIKPRCGSPRVLEFPCRSARRSRSVIAAAARTSVYPMQIGCGASSTNQGCITNRQIHPPRQRAWRASGSIDAAPTRTAGSFGHAPGQCVRTGQPEGCCLKTKGLDRSCPIPASAASPYSPDASA